MSVRNAIIVDDERLARRELRAMLEEAHASALHVVAEAESVSAAAELVRTCDADVVFLDVQLAGESGLELLPLIDPSVAVVFVTAFDQYAVSAFEVNACQLSTLPSRFHRTGDDESAIRGATETLAGNGRALAGHCYVELQVSGGHCRLGQSVRWS